MSPHEPTDAFDTRARAAHAASLEHLSPRVQAQLAQRRRAALGGSVPRTPRRGLAWAGVATAGLALVLAVQLRPPSPGDSTRARPTEAATATAAPRLASLDATRTLAQRDAEAIAPDLTEDPDFYVWLADASPARME